MLGLILSNILGWIKSYKNIAKTSPFYVFGSGTEDYIVTDSDEFLTVPAASTQEGANYATIFDYKNLVIPEGRSLSITATGINPVVIRCTESLTVNGHLHVNNSNPRVCVSDDQTKYLLGRDILKNVQFNYNESSISHQTYSTIKAYAENNILTNFEIKHAGNASYGNSSTLYPAKGGMLVLYYNTLNNNGEIHANGAMYTQGTTSQNIATSEKYGGSTLILCAPIINVGINGKITADGGKGGGYVATLNTPPEQVSTVVGANHKLTAYVSSFPAIKNNAASYMEEPVLTQLPRFKWIGKQRYKLKLVGNDSCCVFVPNKMTDSAIIYIEPTNNSASQTNYLCNATGNTYFLYNYITKAFIGTCSPVTGYTLYYDKTTLSWSMLQDDTISAYTSGITGTGTYKQVPVGILDTANPKKVISYSFSINNPDDVHFYHTEYDPTRDLVNSNLWDLNIYVSKRVDWPPSVEPPKLYAVISLKSGNTLTHICTTNTVSLKDITTVQTRSWYDSHKIWNEPIPIHLTGEITDSITVQPGDLFVVDLYLQSDYTGNYGNELLFYLGYSYFPVSEEVDGRIYFFNSWKTYRTYKTVMKGPYLSTITTSESDITGRGGAGLCIGVQLPKVY